ncbi:hypothetical protein RA180_18985 [Aeromonas salmonicida]|uniref:hypothetical protein n=1 Tax=Aeromonas salmonicida TaxID=645 RepID=UPI0027967AA7|nr:hypothetical protein [Aeromonas salmonicida]MDQ1886083.1 hypothetical protein [Aeromonas salmonicida]
MKGGFIFISCSMFPMMALAASPTSLDINIMGVVEAPTCSTVQSEQNIYQYNMSPVMLSKLVSMQKKTGSYATDAPDMNIVFKCDGAAEYINFKFTPSVAKVCRIVSEGADWPGFCNEFPGGASMGIAYLFNWKNKNNIVQNIPIYTNRDFSTIESGLVDKGFFELKLTTIYKAAYGDVEAMSPGKVKYTMGITIWSE